MEDNYKKQNIKKFYEEKRIIGSYYYQKQKASSILVTADIHYHPHVNKELYKLLISHCQKVKPDYIVMPGDQIETINFIDNPKEKYFFESFLKEMADVAPLIIIPGNHEMGNFDVDKCIIRNYSDNKKSIQYFESLNRFPNIYFLNNEQIKIKNMMFLGFSPRLETYLRRGNERINEMFIEDYLKSGLKVLKGDYNLLLTHNPLLLNESLVTSSIHDFSLIDLTISGHLHDGYLPKKLDKIVGDSNFGLFFTPFASPIPGMICRGIHDFGRGYLFISQGFRKWTADISLFNAFEQIIANDVERLIITHCNSLVPITKKLTKVKTK